MTGFTWNVCDGVASLRFNRPEVKNTIDPPMLAEISELLGQASEDGSIRCVTVSGAGGDFCSGADIKYFESLFELDDDARVAALERAVSQGGAWMEIMEKMPQPVVASVRGAVGGSGMAFVCCADVVIASESAFFVVAHIHLGAPPDGGATYYLPRLLGTRQAKRLAMLGERISAKEAYELGLVTHLVTDDVLDAETEKIVRRLTRSAPYGLAGAKALINQSYENSLKEQLAAESRYFSEASRTSDFQEGVRAFIEKRRPEFTS